MNERMAVSRRFLVRGCVAGLSFQMLQKIPDDPCVEIFEAECRRGCPESTANVSTQELERVAVTGNGVLADAFLGSEVLAEKGGDQGCERRHEFPPFAKSSHLSAILAKSAGVASRYQ